MEFTWDFFFIIITVLSAPAKEKSPALEGFSPQYGGWKDYVNNLPVWKEGP